MKKLFKLLLASLVLFTAVACESDEDTTGPKYLEVTYANIAGTWKLTSWNDVEQTENPYMYLVLDRKEHKFDMYQNLDSGKSRHITGTYTLVMEDDRMIIKGMYDHASGFWNHDYFISELGLEQMTWTITDNENDISVYTRCETIPEDVINGTRATIGQELR